MVGPPRTVRPASVHGITIYPDLMSPSSTSDRGVVEEYLRRLQLSPLEIIASAIAIGTLVGIGELTQGVDAPLLVPSLAASIAILFMAPRVTRALAWTVVGGQVLSGAVGLACALFLPTHISIGTVVAVVAAFVVMRLARCLHPPGLATAVIVVVSPEAQEPWFLIFPLLAGSLLIVGVAVVIDAIERRRRSLSGR
jgi:CBS domain-containing membrane protein